MLKTQKLFSHLILYYLITLVYEYGGTHGDLYKEKMQLKVQNLSLVIIFQSYPVRQTGVFARPILAPGTYVSQP